MPHVVGEKCVVVAAANGPYKNGDVGTVVELTEGYHTRDTGLSVLFPQHNETDPNFLYKNESVALADCIPGTMWEVLRNGTFGADVKEGDIVKLRNLDLSKYAVQGLFTGKDDRDWFFYLGEHVKPRFDLSSVSVAKEAEEAEAPELANVGDIVRLKASIGKPLDGFREGVYCRVAEVVHDGGALKLYVVNDEVQDPDNYMLNSRTSTDLYELPQKAES